MAKRRNQGGGMIDKLVPENLTECDLGLSNFDNTIDDGLEERLKSNKEWAQHSAWNFCGHVWYEDGFFYNDVWQYKCHVETIRAESLEDLMEEANNKYGWD